MTAPRWEDVAASIDRAQRHLDCVPMPCVETQLAILELQTAEQLVGDIRDAALARLAEPTTAAERLMRGAAAIVDADDGEPAPCVYCVKMPCKCEHEPAPTPTREPTAAERWRAVPAEERGGIADVLGDVMVPPRLLAALRALLALGREEGER